jgi:Icc-related predicted phosphoesterase
MRILCLSDLHNDRPAAFRLAGIARSARVELAVSAGDLACDGEHLPTLYGALNASFVSFLCVPGDHDGKAAYEAHVGTAGWHDLHGTRARDASGWIFAGWGVHGDDELPGHEEERQRDDPVLTRLVRQLEEVPPERVVLVAHVPPRATRCGIDRRGIDRGSVQLRRWVDRFQPFAVVCGHVHHREAVTDRIGRSLVVNAGPHGHVLDLP